MSSLYEVPPGIYSLIIGFFGIFDFVNNNFYFSEKGVRLMKKNNLWVKTGVAAAGLIVPAS